MMPSEPPADRYSVDECDVEDKARLVAFRAKRLGWSALLEYDAAHSVSSQLSTPETKCIGTPE